MDPKSLQYKFVQIFLPLLALAVAFTILYSAVNWLLFSGSGLVPLDQDLANLWLPAGLGLLLAGVLITPRLGVLEVGKNRGPAFYWMAAAAVLIAPALFAQPYVATASGKLTTAKSASAIPSAPRTKYYAAGAVCIDRGKLLIQRENHIEGRSNQYLVFNIYVLVPVCETVQQPAWIGFKYTRSVDNGASEATKEADYREFTQASQELFDTFNPARIRYLEALGRNSDRRSYEKALPKTGGARTSIPLILIPHEEAFEARTGDALSNTAYAFGISAFLFLLMLLFPTLDRKKVAEAKKPRSERAHKANDWLMFVVPQRDAYGLPILIDINIAVFLAMVFSGLGVISFPADDLLAWGANYAPAVHGLGVYRLITSQFVHGGLMHLASNMYGLLIGGLFLTAVMRKGGLIACYLVCGLAGSIASVMTHPAVMSVGASGAIMGLWGVLLTLALLGDKRIAAGRGPVVVNCLLFAGLTLAQGVVNPSIDNAAHIGGLAAGLVIGGLVFLYSWRQKRPPVPAA